MLGFHQARMIDVQMAPWHGDVGRLASEPAGDMETGQHLGQPVHVPEILDRGCAPHALKIANIWRTLHDAESHCVWRDLETL
ncbi:hypothetical protein SLT36_25805 [Aminobacter sp. BA135]